MDAQQATTSTSLNNVAVSHAKDDSSSTTSVTLSQPASESSTGRKKRNCILKGVVVAFSGYKNPFRSELREMCLKLGARYRQDWTDDCTHLICAFPNTPKWHSVKGKGIIVSHRWIQECNATKRCVSWRPYRVGRAPSPVGHISGDNRSEVDREDSDWEQSIVEAEDNDEWRPASSDQDEESDDFSGSDTSAESISENEEDDVEEDEIRKDLPARPNRGKMKEFTAMSAKPRAKGSKAIRNSKAGQSLRLQDNKRVAESEDTDEEIQKNLLSGEQIPTGDTTPLPSLPDIFNGKKFYIFSKDFDIKEEEVVYRLIITFGGKVELHMSKDVEFVVSRATWCDDFDEALEVCSSIIFVKPEWIYACDKAGKLVPFQRYQIVG